MATTKEPHSNLAPRLSFPVVAIGASAGGLAAFSALLKALPPKSGMAFVLIQHLEPGHESALASLLARVTAMKVVEVSDGIAVEPNHVYVIPPNKKMTIRKGALRLTPRAAISGLSLPIDDFSLALAEEQGSSSIGVVLSGTGSDGTYGLKAIKAAGGVTLAQDPETAEWRDMPTHAITAGAVDLVLSPRKIADELARIGRHPWLREAREVPEGSDLDKVCLILRSACGIDLRLYKQPTVRRRIARRMALLKIASLEKYAQALKQNQEEARALADDIFIHVTSFFRNPECFQALQRRAIAKLCARRKPDDPIRIWVAGCSTGEEVYSLAILLLEALGDRAARTKIQIFGTDVQERAVAHARAGIYSQAGVLGVSPARLKRFFVKADRDYQIQEFVRDLCVFAHQDLARDPPFSRLDLVSCRNALIYMGPALQRRVLSLFQYALKPGGFLFLGDSESIADQSDAFEADDARHRIFVRRQGPGAFREVHAHTAPARELAAKALIAAGPTASQDYRREAEAALLEHFAPPAIVVDSDLRIVHFQGDTSPYMAPATGQPSFHLLKMVRPGLVVDLRSAIYDAQKSGATVHRSGVRMEHAGRPVRVGLSVRPLRSAGNAKRKDGKGDLLVVFHKSEAAPEIAAAGKPADRRVERLERELAALRERSRALISEHDVAQEEMRAASEEILSSNEELQSTNEELETAREELQSSNEELSTLNNELQHRNTELSELTADLNNLMVGIDLAVLVLDEGLCVRRFTPLAGSLLNLLPADVGRPFSNIVSNLNVPDWKALFAEVTEQGRPAEQEVSSRDGHRYSLRVRPYKLGNEISGVLVLLFNVDATAVQAEQLSESILNSLPSQVAVLAHDGTILAVNEAWNRFARANGLFHVRKFGIGANYLEVCSRATLAGEGDAQVARDGIREVIEGRSESFHLDYPCHSPTEQRWFAMYVSPLRRSGAGAAAGAVVTHVDITANKQIQEELKRSEFTTRALLDSSTQSVIAVNESGKIVLVNGCTEEMFGYSLAELIGKRIDLLVPADRRGRHTGFHKTYFANMQTRPMGIGLELEGRRKDGTQFPVEIALSAIESSPGKLAVAFVTDITQRRRLEKAAQTHAQEVQELAASLFTVQEDERRRVSRELHDQICQQLASLAMDISAFAAEAPPRPKERQQRLKALQAQVTKVSDETRHIAYELHPSVLDDLGVVASLRSLCKEFSGRSGGVAVEFDGRPLTAPVPREIASCLYRVAQQSLQNIVKHAGAKRATVSLTAQKGAVLLTIKDDGEGFDAASVKGRGGLGLVGMEERARLVHGNLTITSSPGRGTRIALRIPLRLAKSNAK